MLNNGSIEVKLSPKRRGHALRVPEVESPTFHDSRHMKGARFSALCTVRLFFPINIPGTHFDVESTPRPECCRKDYVNEKFH